MAKADIKLTTPEKMPPMVHLNEDDLPEIKQWQVGKEYKILLVVKQVSYSVNEYDKGKAHAGFEIKSAKAIDSNADTKDFKEFESEYSKK